MNSSNQTKPYFGAWIALLLLLAVTVALAYLNLGSFNTLAALGIALSKMAIVVLIFMHGRHEKALTWLFIVAGFVWFLIMIELTLSDYLTRPW